MFTVNSKQIHIGPQEAQRFWNRVTINEREQCWPWKSTLSKGGKSEGYGRLKIHQQTVAAHRVAFYLGTHRDPGTLFVCHKCDNPSCCNPVHLFLGTHEDNMRDRTAKGRSKGLLGTNHHRSKLNDQAIRVIRLAYATGKIGCRPLAEAFCVSKDTVRGILKGRGWTHVP